MTRRSLSELKPKIVESISALDSRQSIHRWILCLSLDATGKFLDWLGAEIAKYSFISDWEVWDRTEINRRLEESPEVFEAFFFPVWQSLAVRFRRDELELIGLQLKDGTGWRVVQEGALYFSQIKNSDNDLVLDVTVRNPPRLPL
jgi:hypothetical protein